MAYKITEDCISCGACEPECPNAAIKEGDTTYVIDPVKCTECVDSYPSSKCAEVCPVDASKPDPVYVETKEQLLAKRESLNPGQTEGKIPETQRDLFGNEIKPEYDNAAIEFRLIDENNFESRFRRFKYLDNFISRNEYREENQDEDMGDCQGECSDFYISGTMEKRLLFEEARLTFINGAYVATILLCQAFIEHWLTEYLNKNSKILDIPYNLEGMLKLCRKEGLMHIYLIEKINNLRLKRNPIMHPKARDYPYSISQRLNEMVKDAKTTADTNDLLEQDAKNAIEIMHAILEY